MIRSISLIRLPFFFAVAMLAGVWGFADTLRTDTDSNEQKIVERYWTLLEKSPRPGTSFDRVYAFYVDTGKLDDLVRRCRDFADQSPERPEGRLLLGLVLARQGKDREAVEAFRQAGNIDAGDYRGPFYLGEISLGQGNLQSAAEALETAYKRILDRLDSSDAVVDLPGHRIDSNDLMRLLQRLGRIYERFADRENADRIWNRLEEFFPGDPDILLQTAETLEEEGKLEEALDRYRKAAQTIQGDDSAMYRARLAAADLTARLGDREGALAAFEKLLVNLASDSWQARSVRDRIERLFPDDFNGLVDYYRKRLEQRPGEPETTERLAALLLHGARQAEARDLLEDAVLKNPSNISLRRALIENLVADKQFAEAARRYAEINALQPNNPDDLSRWASVVMADPEGETKTERAAEILYRYLDLDPEEPARVSRTAGLMEGAGIPGEAEKLFRKTIRLRPDDPGPLEALGHFYHRQKRRGEAVAAFRQTVRGDRRSAESLAGLGDVFRSLGYREEAVAALREAVDEKPDDFDLRLKYAKLLTDAADFDGAEREFRELDKAAVRQDETYRRFLSEYVGFLRKADRLTATLESLRVFEREDRPASEHWKRATLQAASGRWADAVRSIEKATELKPDSIVLWADAADILEKGNFPERAAEIFEKLVRDDSRRRLEYLKRLAELRKELGRIDLAIETARLVMAAGAGNPENTRYFAEMLIADGRIEEGIEILRRAARQDASDTSALSSLANLLFETGEVEESFEILWRIFEKADTLREKLAVVSRLTVHYRQVGRFDKLVDRLHRLSNGRGDRRLAVFCLAQAHLAASDLEEARRILETLLPPPDGDDETNRILFARLSSVSETLGDFASAVRYQKMLCEISNSAAENDRLLVLYRKNGDEKAATGLIFQVILESGDLRVQISALDDLLAHADYDSAWTVLSALEAKHPENWELLYRRLAARFWRGDAAGAGKTAEKILALNIPPQTSSLEKRYETISPRNPAPPFRLPAAPSTENVVSIRSAPPLWRFEARSQDFCYDRDGFNRLQLHWARSNIDLFETVFRERLLPAGSVPAAPTSLPSRPLFVPETFADARFAALVWRLRIVFDHDLETLRKKGDVEIRRLGFLAPDAAAYPFAGFRDALKEFRERRPLRSNNRHDLEERLRLEYFLDQARIIIETNKQTFGETDYVRLFFEGLLETPVSADSEGRRRDLLQAVRDLRSRFECELAFRGDTNWYAYAADQVLRDLIHDDSHEIFNRIDVISCYKNLAGTVEVRDRFSAAELEDAGNGIAAALERFRAERELRRSRETRLQAEKIEFLHRFWEELDAIVAEGRLADEPDKRRLLSWLAPVAVIFKELGSDEDMRRLDVRRRNILGHLPPLEAAVWENEILLYQNAFSGEIGGRDRPLTRFFYCTRPPFFSTIALEPDKPASRDEASPNVFNEIEAMLKWKENPPDIDSADREFDELAGRLDGVKNLFLERRRSPGNISVTGRFSTDTEPLFDLLFVKYFSFRTAGLLDRLKPIPLDPRARTVETRQFISGSLPRKAVTITPDYLERILEAERDVYRIFDAYFRLMNELDAVGQDVPPQAAMPSLLEYRRFFERWQGNRLPNSAVGESTFPPAVFFHFYTFLETTDHFLATNSPQPGLDSQQLRADRLVRFNRYLEEKRNAGTSVERRLTGQFRVWLDDIVRHSNRTPKSAGEFRQELEAEEKAATECGEKLTPHKLLMLAVYNRWDGKPEKAAEYLDAVSFVDVADRRLREFLIFGLFKEKPDSEILKRRAETAVDRLLGFQLKESELLDLFESLVLLEQDEKAERLLDRLMTVATSINTQYKLLDSLRKRGDVAENPKAARFALKVLHGPALRGAMPGRVAFASDARNLALEILERADRLHEYAEQVEKQFAVSPDSPELILSLADLYFRMDRQDEAMELVGEIEKMVASRKLSSQDYENMLGRGGLRRRIADNRQRTEIEDAAFRLKSWARTPEKPLENLPVQVLVYERTHLIPDFIDLLKKNRPDRLVEPLAGVMGHVENWLDNFYSREAARGLLHYVWTMDGVEENRKRALRLKLLSSFSSRTGREECYPMFHESVFDILETENGKKTTSALFLPTHIDPDRIRTPATTFLDLAEKLGKLDELARHLRPVSTESPIAGILLAVVELRRKNDGRALDIIQSLQESADGNPREIPAVARSFLAMESAESVHPALRSLAKELIRAELESLPENGDTAKTLRRILERLEKDENVTTRN